MFKQNMSAISTCFLKRECCTIISGSTKGLRGWGQTVIDLMQPLTNVHVGRGFVKGRKCGPHCARTFLRYVTACCTNRSSGGPPLECRACGRRTGLGPAGWYQKCPQSRQWWRSTGTSDPAPWQRTSSLQSSARARPGCNSNNECLHQQSNVECLYIV